MGCNIKANKIDYYIPQKQEYDDLYIDQTVLITEGCLDKLNLLKGKVKLDEEKEAVDLYPYVNAYYNHTEDCDPLSKVNSLLAQPDVLEQAIEEQAEHRAFLQDTYSERAARERFLEAKPVSFIILGKPDIGQQELGRQLANYWNCVYIEPETLIEEEISSGSRAGECIEFNLRCGRAIGIDIILKLVEKRTKSESSKHRGFIITGLPVIPNDLYEEDPESSQSAIFTAKDIFDELFGVVTHVHITPSKPQVSVSSKYQSEADESGTESHVNDSEIGQKTPKSGEPDNDGKLPVDIGEDSSNEGVDIGQSYEKQLSFLFNLLEYPYYIVYVHCSTIDVLSKRTSYRLDIATNQVLDLQRKAYNQHFQNNLIVEKDLSAVEDIFDPIFLNMDEFRQKYLVSLPCHFKANVSSQLDRYHYNALRFIQNRVITHDPEYFVKVDGRTSVSKMLSLIKERLKVMKVQKVLDPIRLTGTELDTFYHTDDTLLAEDQTQYSEIETQNITPEECFKQLKNKGAPSSFHTWSWTEWGTRCPVAMKNGFIKTGDIKYLVQFMNKIFFLADYDSYLKFYRNPRPFLLPPYPRAACKIFIFGPPLSGRSAVAQCLGYYLNGTVLSTAEMMKEFMHQRQDEYLEKVKQQAIAEGIALLNQQRKIEAEEKEKQRVEQIKEWVKTVLNLLEQMSNVLEEIEREEKKEQFEISSFPMAMKRVQTTDVLDDSEFAIALSKIREELTNLNVPIRKMDQPTWRLFFTERKKLLAYLPPDLISKYRPKPATVFDDFVKEYVENALAKAGFDNLQISGGSILEMFTRHIKAAEQRNIANGLGHGGWIIDGMMCNLQVIKELYPDFVGDDIIVLTDDDKFLVERYKQKGTTFFRDFRNFFKMNKLDDAAWRSPSLQSTQGYKEGLVGNILEEIFENDEFYDKPLGEDEEDINRDTSKEIYSSVEQYQKDIRTFQKDWLKIKPFYLEHNIQPLEVDVSNKSLPEVFQKILKIMFDKYKRYTAYLLTEEDRSQEVVTYGDQKMNDEVFGEDVTVADSKSETAVESLRKYGSKLDYCPVTYEEDFVLWKGKEDFAVCFNEKVYLLSSEYDMKKFIDDPLPFLPNCYPDKFPPPRVCIIGVSGCGKTFLSKAISDNFGLIHISFEIFLKHRFNLDTTETLNDLRNTATNSVLRSYLRGEKPLPDMIMEDLKKFWFNEPFNLRGFVFDDFPKSLHDFDFMAKNKLIPEIVILPNADKAYLKTKFIARNLATWQKNIDKKRSEYESKYNTSVEKWKEQRTIRFNELMEERREGRYKKKVQEALESADDDESILQALSQVSFDSVAEQEDSDEVTKILDTELPPPTFEAPVEDPKAFLAKIEPFIEKTIKSDVQSIAKVKEKCLTHNITLKEIPLNLDDLNKTKLATFLIVEPFKFRSSAFFESVYDVSLEVADKLLSTGFFVLSKFGKTCPVQYNENKDPVQLFLVAEEKGNLYTVTHRSYVYFIVGLEQKNKFKNDPLKYIKPEFRFPLIRFKVAVIGPPKCGKTTLVKKIQKEFGFHKISRGLAIRYVLKYLSESDLAKSMESVLRRGWELTDDMVIRAVEAAAFDKRAVTQGVVFDGFPNNINEVRHLSYVDLLPNLIIDLQANKEQIFECLANDQPRENLPKYGRGFMRRLYSEWGKEAEDFRYWYDREYQAIVKIPIKTCNWSVWKQSKQYIDSTFWEIKHYFKHIVEDWPLRLANMLVSPLEFLERQSTFKHYCPLCLHYSNILISGGDPPDRTGLVQFRQFYYWLCNDHIELFLKSPETYLPPYTKHGMPSNLPKKCTFNEMPDNVYENGSCAVCYRAKRIVTKGKLNLSATYNEKSYLFDSVECLNEFLKNPNSYLFVIEFRAPEYPDLNYQDLPVLGMLEQYVAKYLVQGVSFVAKRRPIIPGLGISASALIGLGLFIKTRNEHLPSRFKPYYEEGFRLYNERRKNLLKYLDTMKTYRNPYLHYEEPMPSFQLPPPTPKTESLTTMVSRLVDKCVEDIDIYLANSDSSEDIQY